MLCWLHVCGGLNAKELLAGLPPLSAVSMLKGHYVAAYWSPAAAPSAYQAFWPLVNRFHDQSALVWGEECNHDLH